MHAAPEAPRTFWDSVRGSKKAISAGFTWVVAFLVATLTATGGNLPTWKEWIVALVGYIPAHALTYSLTNEPTRSEQ